MAPAAIPVAVVVLNYNGKGLLQACLGSWSKASPAPARILVVDNGSSDGSLGMLRSRFPKAEVLALKKNLGFAAGNNRGFDRLFKKGPKPEAVFICNNDTEVEPDMLGKLWRGLKAGPRWGIAGPKILFFGSKKIWFKGGSIDRLSGNPGHLGYGRPDSAEGGPFELGANGFVTGCGLLIRSSLLRQLKGFDEGYWAYAEDSDLCLRARALGFASGVVPQARMSHKVSASFGLHSPLSRYYGTRNSLFLLKRHRIGLGPLTRGIFIGLVCGKRVLAALLLGRPGEAGAILAGLRDYFRGARGPRPSL